jgi:hypothetical protein
MRNCEKCRVLIKGSQKVCPLCGGIVHENGEHTLDEFPQIPTIYQEFHLFIRIMILASISAAVICFAINVIWTKESDWSLLVAAGILCTWISMFFILRKKNNIPKTIIWQVFLIGILSVLWDRSIGWLGWSVDYVIPSICVCALIVMAISANMLHIGARDLVIYLLIDVIFGFVPLLLLFTGVVHVIFPSVICTAASAISLSAILLFEWDNMKTEINKRMHI